MKIGVTGTRSEINHTQMNGVHDFLLTVITAQPDSEFHHGDCVGADHICAIIARNLGYKVICHPPEKSDLRAFHESDVTLPPLSYFARNRNIVNMTDRLLVVPYQDSPQKSGGTWYTYFYAIKVGKPTTIIYPFIK
jgi:hypothetical protein